MHAMEATRWRDPRAARTSSQTPRAPRWRSARSCRRTCYGTQAALFNLLIYCDDARLACVGAGARPAPAARLPRVDRQARAAPAALAREKQQTGVGVVWLGAHLSSALGLSLGAQGQGRQGGRSLRTALRGELPVGDYRRLLGYLVSLLFMVGGRQGLLHHIFRPVKPGEEIDAGPATLVTVDELMRAVLERWLALIMDVPGASMLAAFRPSPPPATTTRHRIRADAALEGTPSPGLGGWLYGHWFAVAIADQPGLERLDIPHLEFIAAGLSIITFAGLLTGASLICIETDALATATNLTRRATPPGDAGRSSTPSWRRRRTTRSHRASESPTAAAPGNPMADAASRGYASTLAALSEALGVTSTRMPSPTRRERSCNARSKAAAHRHGTRAPGRRGARRRTSNAARGRRLHRGRRGPRAGARRRPARARQQVRLRHRGHRIHGVPKRGCASRAGGGPDA